MFSSQNNRGSSSLFPKVKQEWRYKTSIFVIQITIRMHAFCCLMISLTQNRLRGSGHGIAAARMDAKLNAAGWISEQLGGVR